MRMPISPSGRIDHGMAIFQKESTIKIGFWLDLGLETPAEAR